MRLLVVADTFFPDAPGGLGRVAWDVAKAMARRGHEVGLLAGNQTSSQRDTGLGEDIIDGVRVYRYSKAPRSSLNPFRAEQQIAETAAALRSIMDRTPYDVLHCHSIFTANAALATDQRIPVVQTVHSPTIQELTFNWSQNGLLGRVTGLAGKPVVRRMETQAMTAAAARHALSRFTVAMMRAEYAKVPADYDVIPHWVDPAWCRSISKAEARTKLGWPADEPIFFTVRQLRRRYGVDTAVEAVAPLARAGRCRFYIGGDGAERHSLAAMIGRLGAEKGIHLLGQISDENLRLAYQAADVFLLPTRALECFGLIILEALACGLPVLGTRVGAIPENLGPILPDWVIPPDDPSAMRRHLEAFLDGSLASPSADDLASYAVHEYNEHNLVSRYENLFGRAAKVQPLAPGPTMEGDGSPAAAT